MVWLTSMEPAVHQVGEEELIWKFDGDGLAQRIWITEDGWTSSAPWREKYVGPDADRDDCFAFLQTDLEAALFAGPVQDAPSIVTLGSTGFVSRSASNSPADS